MIEIKFVGCGRLMSENIWYDHSASPNKQSQRFIFHFQPEFYQVCHTKADYDEHGPSICRHNPVFGTMS